MLDGNIHAKHLWVPIANGLRTAAVFDIDSPPDRSSPVAVSVLMDGSCSPPTYLEKPGTP